MNLIYQSNHLHSQNCTQKSNNLNKCSRYLQEAWLWLLIYLARDDALSVASYTPTEGLANQSAAQNSYWHQWPTKNQWTSRSKVTTVACPYCARCSTYAKLENMPERDHIVHICDSNTSLSPIFSRDGFAFIARNFSRGFLVTRETSRSEKKCAHRCLLSCAREAEPMHTTFVIVCSWHCKQPSHIQK